MEPANKGLSGVLTGDTDPILGGDTVNPVLLYPGGRLSRRMQVRDVMTEDCVTVPLSATLHDCVERMLEAHIGSVVVDDDAPVGIITETDVLVASYEAGESLDAIPAHEVMSQPVKHIRPTATVRAAAQRMREEGVKKLLVADGLTPRGMVTMTDIVWHLSDLQREAGQQASRHRRTWNGTGRFR